MGYIVYKHTSPSGKVYIGITGRTTKERWGKNGNGYKYCPYFYRAIEKYGWDNIKHEILYEGLTEEEACEMEIKLIAEYKSNEPEYGYNWQLGGTTGKHGRPYTEEGFNPFSVTPLSEEGRQRIREKNTRVFSKPVLQYSKDGDFIAEYPSATEAANHLGKHRGQANISTCIAGKIPSAYGYVWKLKGETNGRFRQ